MVLISKGYQMKKKIVHIVESFGGGVFSYLSDLVTGTSDRYDITILYGERKQTPNNISDYFPANVKLIKINNIRKIKLYFYNINLNIIDKYLLELDSLIFIDLVLINEHKLCLKKYKNVIKIN